ncbi:MAG TPA: hypothetical protein VFG86_00370 [Chloroflexota bacterium]|nr:hypothetical protein [Chloroflexota bacterium]
MTEPHTLTSNPDAWMLKFDSAFLLTDEQFTLTCTERGRHGYYCRVHGAPDSDIMTRTTVVE